MMIYNDGVVTWSFDWSFFLAEWRFQNWTLYFFSYNLFFIIPKSSLCMRISWYFILNCSPYNHHLLRISLQCICQRKNVAREMFNVGYDHTWVCERFPTDNKITKLWHLESKGNTGQKESWKRATEEIGKNQEAAIVIFIWFPFSRKTAFVKSRWPSKTQNWALSYCRESNNSTIEIHDNNVFS